MYTCSPSYADEAPGLTPPGSRLQLPPVLSQLYIQGQALHSPKGSLRFGLSWGTLSQGEVVFCLVL